MPDDRQGERRRRVRHIVYEVTRGNDGLVPFFPPEIDIEAIIRYHPNTDPRRPILGELEVEWEE